MNDPVLDLLGHLSEVHVVATTSGALHLELRAIVLMESLERLDQEEVGSKPDWTCSISSVTSIKCRGKQMRTSPVGVPTKHAALGVAGPVFYTEVLAVHIDIIGVILVI